MNSAGSRKPDHLNLTIPNFTFYLGLLLTAAALTVTILLNRYYDFRIELRDYLTLFSSGIICTTLAYHSKNVALTHRYHIEKLALDRQRLESDRVRMELDADRRKLELTFMISND